MALCNTFDSSNTSENKEGEMVKVLSPDLFDVIIYHSTINVAHVKDFGSGQTSNFNSGKV